MIVFSVIFSFLQISPMFMTGHSEVDLLINNSIKGADSVFVWRSVYSNSKALGQTHIGAIYVYTYRNGSLYGLAVRGSDMKGGKIEYYESYDLDKKTAADVEQLKNKIKHSCQEVSTVDSHQLEIGDWIQFINQGVILVYSYYDPYDPDARIASKLFQPIYQCWVNGAGHYGSFENDKR
jgi:hypothetical protein